MSDSTQALWDVVTEGLVHQTRHLEGQLCTFVDATTSDGRQAKAAKDTVKTLLWAYERGIEESFERSLSVKYHNSEMALAPQWLEERFKRER